MDFVYAKIMTNPNTYSEITTDYIGRKYITKSSICTHYRSVVKNVCPCQNVTGFGRVGERFVVVYSFIPVMGPS